MRLLALYVLLVCFLVVGVSSQTCTFQDNVDYDNGFLTQLYGLQSADACCAACNSFEECATFSWVKSPNAGSYYQMCYIHTSSTGQRQNMATTAGNAAKLPPTPPSTCGTVEDNTDYNNGWLSLLEKVPSADACCYACSNYPGCNYWSYIKNPAAGAWYQRCFFKKTNEGRQANSGNTAGSAHPIALPAKKTGKRGVAWFNTNSCTDLKLLKGVSWIYNWGTTPDAAIQPCLEQNGFEYIPMQWGAGGIVPDLNFTIYGNSKHLLAFNEPNFVTQSNVLPAQAAQLWPTLRAIADERGMKLGSPAAAACGPDLEKDCYAASWNPQPWFDAFFRNCTGCKVDFLTTHIYTCNITQFTEFLDGMKKYKLPIWLTEFACPAAGQPVDVEINFMKQALAYLDNEPMIERYAWFGTRLDPKDGWLGAQVDLFAQGSAALTPLGQMYAGM